MEAVPKVRSVEEVIAVINEMLAEVQDEAELRLHRLDRRLLICQRDTLTELKFRIRDGRANPFWTRQTLVQCW